MKYDILDRVVDVGPPKKPLRRANAEGNLTLVQRLLLYDFLEVCLEYMKLWLKGNQYFYFSGERWSVGSSPGFC